VRLLGVILIALVAGFLMWATRDLPLRGDPESPASTHVSVYYIENALQDSNTPNMVTAVLADYRGFDTFGEAVVVVAAALSCLLILLRRRDDIGQVTGGRDRGAAGGAGPDRGGDA
jgi:multicomponent Na+:H+ antiporter subunit B